MHTYIMYSVCSVIFWVGHLCGPHRYSHTGECIESNDHGAIQHHNAELEEGAFQLGHLVTCKMAFVATRAGDKLAA